MLRDKWSGPKSRHSFGQHWTEKTVSCKRVTTFPSTSSQSPAIEGSLSALAFAMHGENHVAQEAQKGRTEVSSVCDLWKSATCICCTYVANYAVRVFLVCLLCIHAVHMSRLLAL